MRLLLLVLLLPLYVKLLAVSLPRTPSGPAMAARPATAALDEAATCKMSCW
jgi:hypothetical protein